MFYYDHDPEHTTHLAAFYCPKVVHSSSSHTSDIYPIEDLPSPRSSDMDPT